MVVFNLTVELDRNLLQKNNEDNMMGKELLLTKSNLKKNKGTTIGVFLLVVLSSMLMGIALLIYFDARLIADKEAERLLAGDGEILLFNKEGVVTDEYVEKLIEDQVKEYFIYRCIGNCISQKIPYGDGELSVGVNIGNQSVFENKRDIIEIVKEDKNITENYIYLPYQFYTGGGVKIGDEYSFSFENKVRSYTVRGFINTIYSGCNNNGIYLFILDDKSYDNFKLELDNDYEVTIVNYTLKKGVRISKFNIETNQKYLVDYPTMNISSFTKENTIWNRTFMSLILTISFIMVTVIVIIVMSLMLGNCITNYIRENMTTLGVLKSIGYTSKNIKDSILIMFTIITVGGSIIGAVLAYAIMPVMAKVVVSQMGFPYSVKFNPAITFGTIIFFVMYVAVITIISVRRLKKIEVVTALRDGTESHNFKKNHIKLDESGLGINASLALKTMFSNKKQNIITFFITGFLMFICTIGLLMYENFNRNPMLEILTFETCGGVVATDKSTGDELRNYLEQREDVRNIRKMIQNTLLYNGEDSLFAYVFEDVSQMNNKNVCYKGRIPEYDNEIAISGKFAKDYGFKIGDEITLNYGDKSHTYLITGFVQSCNNNGREALMSEEAMKPLCDINDIGVAFWYDCDDKETSKAIINGCGEKFKDKIITTINFYEVMDANMTIFKAISAIMLTLMCVIAAIVIMLILFLFIKALLYNKKRDYGIYKAIGFTSRDLIFQTALSFMPAIIISVVFFLVISYFVANPYMQTIMLSFGLMKCNFVIPVTGMVMIGIGYILISFLFTIYQSRKIRKIEVYDMLTEV